MKIHVFLLLLLLPFAACRKDLLHWRSVQRLETGTSEKLNRILFLPDGSGIIAGGGRFSPGILLYSVDQGNSWLMRPVSNAEVGCYGLAYTASGVLYCSGEYGNIFFSKDRGADFERRQEPGFYEFLSAVSFGTATRGVAVSTFGRDSGAIVLLDADGRLLQQKRYLYALNDVLMTGPDTGYIAASGAVLRTTDGGLSWVNMPVVGDNYNRICALDSRRVYICGYNGSVVRSLDGGASWKRLRNGNDLSKPRYRLEGIAFVDEQHGYLVGENGLMAYTDDAGVHWMEFDRFTSATLRCIGEAPDGQLLAGGENGELYKLAKK